MCLFGDSPPISTREQGENDENKRRIVNRGRQTNLHLMMHNREQPFRPMAHELFEDMAPFAAMLDTVERYFQSGRRVCLPGAFALGRERDRFADRVQGYFITWRGELTRTLGIAGVDAAPETALRILAAIQGAIVLSRALDDPAAFRIVLDGARHLSKSTT